MVVVVDVYRLAKYPGVVMQEFQYYYDAMYEMNVETQRFLVSLMASFFYFDVSYKGIPFFGEKDISVTVKDDKCVLSLCTRGEDKYGNKYRGDIISTQDILEFSVFEDVATIKLYCRVFDFKVRHNISIMDIIYRLKNNKLMSLKLNEDNYNYDIIDKGFGILSAVPRIPQGIKYRIVNTRTSSVDEEVAKFCETHNVIDVKTYKGNHDWEKEVVIQYR